MLQSRLYRLIALALFTLLATLILPAIAQEAPKPQRVVITRADGKTVSGELVEATLEAVTVKPSPKAEPVVTKWAEIKRVSNGLTREQVLETYRKEKADQLCATCNGQGTTDCDHCKGTSIEPSTAVDCEKCKGKGTAGDCPKCEAGQMPCPSPCLKANSFSGTPDGEGKRWRQFKGKSGTMRISDAHVGEQVVMENGDPVMKGKCPTCAGKTTVACTTCAATGDRECPTCHRAGKTGPACAKCQKGDVACTACEGSGLKR